MTRRAYIPALLLALWLASPHCLAGEKQTISLNFYGDTVGLQTESLRNVPFSDTLSRATIEAFYERMTASDYEPVLNTLLKYKSEHRPDDWLYYQLIRKTAQAMAPKAENYYRYTLYKWFLLNMSGYNATVNIVGNRLLLYVQNDEDIYDIPYFMSEGKKYVCLNYHDYGYQVDFAHERQLNVAISVPGASKKFSYKLTGLPRFSSDHYKQKDLVFTYKGYKYHLKVKANEEVKHLFNNYPVADYALYFNTPLSSETYNSLIPQLRRHLKGLSVQNGLDYLMHFTREAFVYTPDADHFGREKRLSPEQTLLYEQSDCEDRAALFYCLVKEIYNLPMIAVAYPTHLTIAVKLDKPIGQPIVYNGNTYYVCEPTPQAEDLPPGAIPPALKKVAYEVAYVYEPK